MPNWIGGKVAAVIVAVLALLAAPVTEAIALAPAESHSTYVYAHHHHPAPVTGVVTERGPPETSDHVTTCDADGHRSIGATVRLNAAAAHATYDYDDLAPFMQVAPRSRGAEQVGNAEPASVVVEQWRVAAKSAPGIKVGSQGGDSAGKVFPQSVCKGALDENPSTCVYCRMETDRPQVDHAIPRSRGGNATLDNAQTTCGWRNASKGARDFPVNPPPGFEGMWPPLWWMP